ncbi:hypothetical protein BDD14_5291 [Edaphobacter modestus]|uniref:Uncharacterized protein n=1 Tax=Edaphobacter modestus TaxID=388466 RepID=A0A4Q7Z028_9BACT|nr:hypothetical protein BDD14_5291 [Edaphobacter modestus]
MQSRYVGTMYGFVGERDFDVTLSMRGRIVNLRKVTEEVPVLPCYYSENQVEVKTHVTVVISEELPILRVGGAGMDFKRVEVIRNIGD